MIYLAKCCEGIIKIGCSKDIPRRLKELRRLWPEIILLGAREGSFKEEKELHKFYQSLWIGSELFKSNELQWWMESYDDLRRDSLELFTWHEISKMKDRSSLARRNLEGVCFRDLRSYITLRNRGITAISILETLLGTGIDKEILKNLFLYDTKHK